MMNWFYRLIGIDNQTKKEGKRSIYESTKDGYDTSPLTSSLLFSEMDNSEGIHHESTIITEDETQAATGDTKEEGNSFENDNYSDSTSYDGADSDSSDSSDN